MINPLVLYTAGGALLVGALGGWTVRDWKADSDQLAAVERASKAEKAAIAAVYQPSTDYEQVLANLRPREIQTRNTIREVYRDVEVPTDCAVPAAAVGVLNDARLRANAAASGQPSPTVRGAAENTQPPDRPGTASVGG